VPIGAVVRLFYPMMLDMNNCNVGLRKACNPTYAAGQYSSAKVHNSLVVNSDGSYELKSLDGLVPKEIDGF
jgi:hypothetical protein